MSLIGNMASAPLVLTFGDAPEVRPLPSTGVTRFQQYYGPVRLPAQPETSLTGFRLVIDHHWTGSPVLPWFPLGACRRHYPGRTAVGGCRSFPLCAAAVAFPFKGGGSAPARPVFGACSTFTRVTARSLAESPSDPLSFEASTWKLPAKPLELLPARMTKLPGGIRTHRKPAPFTAHAL
jgi:hypothetical protein